MSERQAISLITVGELYEGAYGTSDLPTHLASLRAFLAPFETIGLTDEIMERFAHVRALLRRQGQIIPDFDILIGVTAVEFDLTVLTNNVRHLGRIPGLKIHSGGTTSGQHG